MLVAPQRTNGLFSRPYRRGVDVSVRVSRMSRLLFAELLDAPGGRQYFDVPDYPSLEAQPDDVMHAVVQNDSLHGLADQYYGNPELQYVLALANSISLWPVGLVPGRVLRIPAPRYVLQIWLPSASPRAR